MDFFYICPSHLKDRNFAIPTEDEAKALEEKRKKAEMDKEIEKIKAEYEEKLKKKREKSKKDKDDKDKKDDAKKDDSEAHLEKEKQDKINAVGKEEVKVEHGARVFRLQKHFYNMRLQNMRAAEQAKRNRERLRDPNTFPAAPTGALGAAPASPP